MCGFLHQQNNKQRPEFWKQSNLTKQKGILLDCVLHFKGNQSLFSQTCKNWKEFSAPLKQGFITSGNEFVSLMSMYRKEKAFRVYSEASKSSTEKWMQEALESSLPCRYHLMGFYSICSHGSQGTCFLEMTLILNTVPRPFKQWNMLVQIPFSIQCQWTHILKKKHIQPRPWTKACWKEYADLVFNLIEWFSWDQR